MNLQLQVTANGQSFGIDEFITREWTLNSKILTSTNSLLSLMNVDPEQSNSIVMDLSVLEDDVSYYELTLKVIDIRNGLNASFTHFFTIATPPKACTCSITPSNGIALETSFTFSCTNCQNSQQTLKVVYGFI